MKYDPSYPLVQEADQEIAATQAAIADAEKTQYHEPDHRPGSHLRVSAGRCCQDQGGSCVSEGHRGGC